VHKIEMDDKGSFRFYEADQQAIFTFANMSNNTAKVLKAKFTFIHDSEYIENSNSETKVIFVPV
jgi:hypothetical protein